MALESQDAVVVGDCALVLLSQGYEAGRERCDLAFVEFVDVLDGVKYVAACRRREKCSRMISFRLQSRRMRFPRESGLLLLRPSMFCEKSASIQLGPRSFQRRPQTVSNETKFNASCCCPKLGYMKAFKLTND